jgi:enediyne biosynthesis protein E3
MLSGLKRKLIGLSYEEASFERLGFPGRNTPCRKHLESVLHTFIDGFNWAVEAADTTELVQRLNSSKSPELVGFAYEGAGLYLGMLDLMLPGASRLEKFTHSVAAVHNYIAMVGAGFAIARAPLGLRRMESYKRRLDELTAFCLADGLGFHEGFFHWKNSVDGQPAPASLDLQDRTLFDSGIARAMWWVYGADPGAIAAAISRFAEARRPEMWAGVGVAMSYASAGPDVPDPCPKLVELAGPYRDDLLSGVPFSAMMRCQAANHAWWTERACRGLLNMSVQEAGDLAAGAVRDLMTSTSSSEERRAKGYLVVRETTKQRLARKLSVARSATV